MSSSKIDFIKMEETENVSTINQLAEIAQLTNRKIFVSEAPYPGSAMNPVTLHKRTVYMPDANNDSCFLGAFSDPKRFDKNNMFFGVFITTSYPLSSTFEVRKKDTLDRINPFLSRKSLRSGNDSFDKAVVINGNDERLIRKILCSTETQQVILDALAMKEYWYAGLNAVDLEFVPDGKRKSFFGIFTRQLWIVDKGRIETLFQLVRRLNKMIHV